MTTDSMNHKDTVAVDDISTEFKALQLNLSQLHGVMSEKGALETAKRVDELTKRVLRGDSAVRIALCGLFSAGKSSLVNALTGVSNLATGAVPTTAAVHDVLWTTPDGPIVLMDTPGIDSTDAAHQAATDAAMHLADVVCLVVDYQHVESEENLEFARQLCERGKRLFIIVNQVDKHVDFELSFASFQSRVMGSLDAEGIGYEALFYTSSRPSVNNQLDTLRNRLQGFAKGGASTVIAGVRASALGLIDEALTDMYADEEWNTDSTVLDAYGRVPLHLEEAKQWYSQLSEQVNQFYEKAAERVANLEAECAKAQEGFERSIDLAQIAPYGTTELGRKYIESLRPGFKVGWFGADKKTAEERDRRLQLFQQDLLQTTQQNLIWPLQRELRSFIHSWDFTESSWVGDIEGLVVEIPVTLLEKSVHRGALESTQYPYQYVKDVVGRVKVDVRRMLHSITDAWWASAQEIMERHQADSAGETADMLFQYEALRHWIEVRDTKEQDRISWRRLLA